ncbi:MAG: hypothetical protein N3A63_08655 [Bacteroidetes bacterium]|nr:hypothetical protein [Bacteroidota bacterium]
MKSRLAIPDLGYLQPLLYGLEKPQSPFELVVDIPARNSLAMSERSSNLRGAFLSPLDYARHGAEYCIVPEIGVASSYATKTILLFINKNVRNITRIAVDIRFTSEIILAKIILLEKYRNLSSVSNALQFIPMMPDLDTMLRKADAALIVQSPPLMENRNNIFALDLVEEWYDLTGLPYVHGVWVGREEELNEVEAKALLMAQREGTRVLTEIANMLAQKYNLNIEFVSQYLQTFTYTFTQAHEESLEEFFHYAFFHGALPDVPLIRYFDLPPIDIPRSNE